MSENLIIKYLSGELTEAEAEKLHEWVTKNEHNKKYFAQIKNSWVSSLTSQPSQNINLEKETELFNYRRTMQREAKNQTVKIKTIHSDKNSFWNLFIKIAAAILLIYSLGISFYRYILPEDTRYNEIATRSGEKSQVTLADGSKIWINSQTKLRYPVHMDSKNVNIYLEGEAFFDVNKIPGRSITVHTSDIKINVLGTAFNVKCYSEDGITETTLVRGKITIDGQTKKLKEKLVLKPNQQATYVASNDKIMVTDVSNNPSENISLEVDNDSVVHAIEKKSPKSKMIVAEKVDTDLYTSWKDGKLTFKSERFENLALRMERWYDVRIEIKNDELKESRYTGTFEKETVEQALKALSLSLPFQYEIEQNEIIITKR